MGGKSKIIDPDQMTGLYVSTKKYKMLVEEKSEEISLALARLSDPGFQSGLQGGQGEAIKSTIKQINAAFLQLRDSMNNTAKFIDDKLAGQAVLNKDKHGIADIESQARAAASQMKLQK